MNIEERAGAALEYLTSTDERAADLKQESLRAEAKYGATVDALFLAYEGSIEVRKALARQAPEAQSAYAAFLEAQRDSDAVANRRKTEAIVIEWLRSLNANRRQGS